MPLKKWKGRQPYGYVLFGHVTYYCDEMLLVNFSKENFKRTQLRATMANLFCYLLSNAAMQYIPDDQIMVEVWEKNNLRASSHRLWQVSRDLHYKLISTGINKPLFTRVPRKRGFTVNKDAVETLLKV